MVTVRVIEFGIAQPHLHVGHAHMVGRTAHQRAILRVNSHKTGVADRVAEEVGRQLLVVTLFAQRGKGAMQLGSHGIQEDRLLRAGCQWQGQGQSGKNCAKTGLRSGPVCGG